MEQTFEEYLKQARLDFAKVAEKYPVEKHLELRTAIDSLMIAYDQAVHQALSIGAVISRFLFDMVEKHNKDKESLCIQVSGDDIELYEVEDDGYHNWLTHIETIENGTPTPS